jgi:DNA-binding MarR family transcriptional regulator
MLLPAAHLSEILANVAALNLDTSVTAAIVNAVIMPLIRSGGKSELSKFETSDLPRRKRRAKPHKRSKVSRQKRKYRRHVGPSEPREKAIAALKKAAPGTTPTEISRAIGVSRGTVVNASKQLAKEERKAARKAARRRTSYETPDRRQRAQRFLKGALADGPKGVSEVEDAAEKAHVDLTALEQARADLGVVVSRSNTGVQAVTWSLPAP